MIGVAEIGAYMRLWVSTYPLNLFVFVSLFGWRFFTPFSVIP